MKSLTKTVFTSSALFFILNTAGFANEVKMYTDQAPSAQEIGSILFSSSHDSEIMAAGSIIKLRSIKFNVANVSVSPLIQAPTTIKVGLPIQFAYNSTVILQQSRRFLNEVGKMLRLVNYSQERLVIEGHTDASGTEEYNQYLSESRARAVKQYLVAHYQISGDRLDINGQGETSPLPGKNPYNAINRRVQFYKTP